MVPWGGIGRERERACTGYGVVFCMCQLSPQAAGILSFLFPSTLFLSSIPSFLFLRCGIRQPIGKEILKKISALSSRFLPPGDAPNCPGIVLQRKAR